MAGEVVWSCLDIFSVPSTSADGRQALAFGYFEALLQTADPSRLLGEVARLTSLNNLLDTVGYLRDIYEDFTDVTLQLLKETAATLPSQIGGAALLESFNDAAVCNAIIMHFRVSISSRSKITIN